MSPSRSALSFGAPLLLAFFITGGSGEIALAAGEEPSPVNVTADKMEYFTEENRAVFKGNALAVQDDVTLAADSMAVLLGEGAEAGGGRVKRITAVGNVTFRQLVPETGKERFATGGKGVYDAEKGVVTLTEEPRLWEGKNVIVAEVMKFFVDEHRFLAEGEVRLELAPSESEQEEEEP